MATRYGRAGGGNWSASGTWSASPGGGSDGAGINTGDDVVLDANSTGTFTIDASASIATIDCTGFTGTLVHTFNGTLTVTGNTFKFVPGMTYTPSGSSRSVTFTSTSGTIAFTPSTKNFMVVIMNGAGGTLQLLSDLSCTLTTNLGLTLTAGTIDFNGFTATVSDFLASGATTRAVIFGSGGLNLTGIGNITFAGSAISVTKNTGTITVSGNTASTRTINTGTAISGGLPGVVIGANTLAGSVTFSGTTSIASLAATAPCRLRFTSSTTQPITAAPNLSGSSSNRFQICSSAPGTAATISVASGTVNFDNAFIEDITGTGGATFAATNSYNVAGNSGITITEPVSGGVISVIGS